MRKTLHATVALIAVIPWLAAMLLMWLVIRLCVLADWIMPDARIGNCWTFALPRWRNRGGYLVIRPSPRPFAFVPHAIWVYSLEGVHLEQTMPRKRARSPLQAWRTLYFPYRVVRIERRPGDTQPVPLGD